VAELVQGAGLLSRSQQARPRSGAWVQRRQNRRAHPTPGAIFVRSMTGNFTAGFLQCGVGSV